MNRIELRDDDVVGIRADNPGLLTLDGTNTWIVGRDPAWLIDPGPDQPEHLNALSIELDARGGLGSILVTHDHVDHAESLQELSRRFSPVPVATSRASSIPQPTIVLDDGDRLGPFEAIATPGHARDHLAFLVVLGEATGIAFTGDAVLGAGSVFVAPDPGALTDYLEGLRALRGRHPRMIAPGHGPLVTDPDAKLADYIEHRLAREQALVAALDRGARTVDELLDGAWSDVPAELRPAAAVTLAAHLDKLDDDGLLPDGVERPPWPVDH